MSSSPRLPPELCDHIIDQLHDQPNELRACSVVSKSWTPRSRKHIFSTISFNNDSDVAVWWNTFPDPSNSPAYHPRTLAVNYRRGFPETHLSSFCNITHLCPHVHQVDGQPTSLAQLHGFTPFLETLLMAFPTLPSSDVLSLVCSFPLLDNLTLAGRPTASDTQVIPFTPPKFSGTLCLGVFRGVNIDIMVNHLSSLPNGIHFRGLILLWNYSRDLPSMTNLIFACSQTLESLDIANKTIRTHSCPPLWSCGGSLYQ